MNVSITIRPTYVPQSDKSRILRKVASFFADRHHVGGPYSPLWRNLTHLSQLWELVERLAARGAAKVARVIAYLFQLEQKEIDPWLRDDLRIAANTVKYAHEGQERPFHLAFSLYFGKQPEKAVRIWQERDRQTQAYLNPKKPVQKVAEVETAIPAKAGK